jgi:hypothetical protein
MEPHFRRTASGQLTLSDTIAAKAVKAEYRGNDRSESRSAASLKAEAVEAVKRNGGDVSNPKHVLGQTVIQFGIYRYY